MHINCVVSIEVQKLIHLLGSDVIHAIGFGDMSRIYASVINAKNGELLKHNNAAFPGGFSGEISAVSTDIFVASDSTRSILVLINVRDGEISFQQTYISDLLQDSSGTAVVLPSRLTGTFAIRINNGFIIFIKVTDEGKLVVADKIDHRATFSDALSFSEGQQAIAIIQQEGSKFQLTVKDVYDWSNDLLTESINTDHSRGLVHKVFINNYIRTDRSHGFRVLIVMEDHSLLLVQQGEIVWSREDGLASVVDTTTSELPVEKHGVSVANVEQNLFEWLKVQSFQKAFQKLVYH